MSRIERDCQQGTIAKAGAGAHGPAMTRRSPLDDPRQAAFAWARYKRLMKFMVLVTLGTVAAALILLADVVEHATVHFFIATGLGIAVSMLLMSALMGLVFLSNGTGHDASVSDRIEDD